MDLLEKPYLQYIQLGGLAEKIFSDYCQKNGLQVIGMGEFAYRLLLYGRNNAPKGEFPWYDRYGKRTFKKKKIDQFMAMFTEEQIRFLEENHQSLEYSINNKIVGLPDFFVWDDNGRFAFIELKSGSSTLSTRQRNVLKKLTVLFPVYVCHISCDVVLKDLQIENIDFGFVSINKEFEFDKGAIVEENLYAQAHKRENR